MAKINAGITGGFTGTVNQVTGYRRNSKSIITGQSTKKRTEYPSSIINNSEAYSQCKKKINIHYRQILNALTAINQQSRFVISDLITLSPRFKNYGLQYFSGTFYFPYDGYIFNGIPAGLYIKSTQYQGVSLSRVSKYYNEIQNRKFLSFRSFSPSGGVLTQLNLNSGNNVTQAGLLTPFPVGTTILQGLTMINGLNQSQGDIVISLGTRY